MTAYDNRAGRGQAMHYKKCYKYVLLVLASFLCINTCPMRLKFHPFVSIISSLLCATILVGKASAQTLLTGASSLPDGLQTVEFYSPAVDRQMKFDIVLPPGYEESGQRYPVLYLLHGYMQNYTVWGRFLGAAEYARRLGDLIVVMPDGGNSWYLNYDSSGEGQSNDWEDHIIRDVIPYVDANFRTEARREGRAISGLSMGGFGAFSLGLRHSRLFVSLGSTSGALSHARTIASAMRSGQYRPGQPAPVNTSEEFSRADQQVAELIDISGFGTQVERTPAGVAFATAEQADAYDPFSIIYDVPRSAMPHLYLDAGTSDQLIADARELAQLLMVNNVPFDYRQAAGGHTAEYWREAIGPMMAVQNEVMQRALQRRP